MDFAPGRSTKHTSYSAWLPLKWSFAGIVCLCASYSWGAVSNGNLKLFKPNARSQKKASANSGSNTGQPSTAAKTPPVPYSFASFPCELNESWKYSRNIPVGWIPKLVNPLQEVRTTLTTLLLSDVFRDNAKNQEQELVAEYWLWRSFYQLSFTHLASQGFNSLILRATENKTKGVKIAATACINKINRLYPTLTLEQAAAGTFTPSNMSLLLSPKKQQVWEAVARGLKLRLSRTPELDFKNPLWEKEKAALLGSGPYHSYIQAIVAARSNSEAEIIQFGQDFLKSKSSRNGLPEQLDPMRLVLALTYYNLNQYDKSIELSKMVKSRSDYFTDSLITRAWSQIQLRNYGGAMGSSQNFLVGGYSHLFYPQANLIVAMALTETCQYLHAIESIQFFQKTYRSSYAWLNQWNKTQTDVYPLLLNYLKKKENVPKRIANFWIKSPLLVANQKELNLITTEQRKAPSLIKQMSSIIMEKRDVRWISAFNRVEAIIKKELSSLEQTKISLLLGINEDLKLRTNRMVQDLADVSDQIQLIEAEAYSKLGDKLIAENFMKNDPKKLAAFRAGKSSGNTADAGPVWDWGEVAMSYREDGNPEIWEDELGFLKSKISNSCERSPGSL